MGDREQRGLALAALYRIELVEGKYIVPSQSGDGRTYTVDPEKRHCTCRDHEDRAIKCKHMYAVEFVQTRERNSDGTETVTRTFKVTERVTYKQDWTAYNLAQTSEKRQFQTLLFGLCDGIQEPSAVSRVGRPPTPKRDQVFAMAFKVYSMLSARRFNCDLQDAAEKGFLLAAPHFNTVLKFFEDESLTPILKALVVESSKPLAAVETAFAIDSSGFSTSRFVRWFDIKYGRTMEEREWVKVHIACGVKTNVVTAIEILGKSAGDAPQLAPLLKATAENFTVKEVSADSAYSSNANIETVQSIGATPYIAFKENTTGGIGGAFAKAFHYYQAFKDDFLKHYHKRSNVESTFSMMKAKFGDSLRANKSDVSMVNETLCKVLCHNLCCLIQSIYELGIKATFWSQEAPPEPVREVELEGDAFAALAWI